MTIAVSSTAARTPEVSSGDAIAAAAGVAVRKATASAAKDVITAVASSAADQLGRAITGTAKKSAKSTTTKKTSTTKKKPTGSTSKPPTTKPGEFDFLKDKSLSPEDRLFRLLALMSKKYDSALDKKLAEIKEKSDKKKAEASKKSSGGLFGGLLKAAGSVVKAAVPFAGVAGKLLGDKALSSLLQQVSGPVLAAGVSALGMPQLAPIVMQLGPQLAAALPEAAKEFGLTEDSSATTSSSSSATNGEVEFDPMDQAEMQRLMEKQKQMFSTVSNVLKAMHDTKMSIIGNIR